jgi:hypothetical protein
VSDPTERVSAAEHTLELGGEDRIRAARVMTAGVSDGRLALTLAAAILRWPVGRAAVLAPARLRRDQS